MINVTRSAMPPFEEYIQTIAPLWESRWLVFQRSRNFMVSSCL